MRVERSILEEGFKEAVIKAKGGHRPRPVMYVGLRNGKRCYVRKHSLSYFQLLEKYPAPLGWVQLPCKPFHVLQRHHHLRKSLIVRIWEWLKARLA